MESVTILAFVYNSNVAQWLDNVGLWPVDASMVKMAQERYILRAYVVWIGLVYASDVSRCTVNPVRREKRPAINNG